MLAAFLFLWDDILTIYMINLKSSLVCGYRPYS